MSGRRLSSFPRLLLAGGIVFSLLGACRREGEGVEPLTDAQVGRDHFPIGLGRFWIYDVEDHYWNYNTDSVVRFQLRERVDTVYAGAGGEQTYRVVRSRRPDSTALWRDDSVLAVVASPQAIRQTFANLPTIELTFPVRAGDSWNPNQLNGADSVSRTYVAVDAPLTVAAGRTWPTALRVVDDSIANPYEYSYRENDYVRGVGRVRRIRRRLKFCNNDLPATTCTPGVPLPDGRYYIARGQERIEVLRMYGPK